MNEVQVRHILIYFWVIAAVDFSIYQWVTHRLKDCDRCPLRLATHFTLKNVIIFYVLRTEKVQQPSG